MFLTEYNIILHPLCPSLHDNYCCMMHKEKASELFESNYGFRNQWGYFYGHHVPGVCSHLRQLSS